MGRQEFLDKAAAALDTLGSLDLPIADANLPDGKIVRHLRETAQTDVNLEKLGSLELSGAIHASLYLTRNAVPPLDLDDIEGDAGETGFAYASSVVGARAGAQFEARSSSGEWQVGARAGARGGVRLAVHRRHSQADNALAALAALPARMIENPFTRGFVRSMPASELFQYRLDGTADVYLGVTGSFGIVREISGETLERMGFGDLGAVKAGVTAKARLTAGVSGRLVVLVERGRTRDHRRVRLVKGSGSHVGGQFGLEASLQLDEDKFTKGLLDRVFELPDGLVDRLREVDSEIEDLTAELGNLADEVKEAISGAVDDLVAGSGLKDLKDELEGVGEPALTGSAVARIDSLLDKLDALDDDLLEFVDEGLEVVTEPLDSIRKSVGGWIESYDKLREKIAGGLETRLKHGLSAEIAAGFNRTREAEALLDLEFDVRRDDALDSCLSAMKGDFVAALRLAEAKGEEGVELISGSLKRRVEKDRFFNVSLNLFGFKISRDFKSWSKLEVTENLSDGSLQIASQAGAKLLRRLGKRLDEIAFVFDLAGGAEKRGQRAFLAPEAGYTATLERGGTVQAGKANAAIDRHLAAAQRFGILDSTAAATMRSTLRGQSGPYEFSLVLSFGPEAVRRALLLESPHLSDEELTQLLWDRYRGATRRLGLEIQSRGKSFQLADLITEGGIAQIAEFGGSEPTSFRPPHISGELSLVAGAALEIWGHIYFASLFFGAYRRVRRLLLESADTNVRDINKAVRKFAKQTVTGVGGTFSPPSDGKYLTLALIEGPVLTEGTLTLKRGSVEIRL